MSFYSRTLKTANTTGYVLALPSSGCSRLTLGCESGDLWVEPLVNQASAPADPTNALVCGTAGVDNSKSSIHLTGGQSRILDLASGYAKDNEAVRFTHVRVWSVTGGFIEVLGA